MHRTSIRSALFAALAISAGAVLAQVDYSKDKQRNPTGDRNVEKGYQDTRKEILDRREKEKASTPKESTGTVKDQRETYGKDWQEKQLGTQGKTRTW